MADEIVEQKTTPQETQPVTEKVTDSDLSSAWESTQVQQETKTDAVEEQVTDQNAQEVKQEHQEVHEEHQETPKEEIQEEPADNAERSRLGRRMKTIEDDLKKLINHFGGAAQSTQPEQTQVPANVTYNNKFVQDQMEAAVERGELPATIVTPQDQYVVNQFINGLKKSIGNQYAVGYIKTLQSPTLRGDTPDEIHAEVVTELQRVESPFNLRRYDNPQLDAQLNYMEAKNHILQQKLASSKPPNVFKGVPKGSPPIGTSTTTKSAAVADDLPALDAHSQDFIKSQGMSPESVRAALKSDMPFHLRRS
jgi:hypothetical protein